MANATPTQTRADAAAARTGEIRQPRKSSTWWKHALAILALVWALFPITFILSAAFDRTGSLASANIVPTNFSMASLDKLFSDPNRPFTNWYVNSMVISLAGAIAAVFIGACAAFAFSRLRFKGRRPGLLALLLLQMFPALLAFVALYITFVAIGDAIPLFGLNKPWGLILAYLGGAMGANVWLLKGYFDTVPKELDEAATVDGASHARIFFTMTLPLVMPILVTVFMIQFVGLFSEFILASIFLRDLDSQTLGVGLYGMTLGRDAPAIFGQFCAGALLASLPVVILYLSFQKQLIGGLTSGSVK